MTDRMRRDLRLLKGYSVIMTLFFGALSIAAFRQAARKTRFTEIDVERINIVEPDGKLRMVIANRPRSIGPIYQGKPFGYPGGGRPGIIFFNDEGTENGGLTFTGRRRPDGTYESSTGMSFDQFNSDEVLTLRYTDKNGDKTTGITIAGRDGRERQLEVVDLKAIGGHHVRATPAVHLRLLLVTCRVTGEGAERTEAPVRFIVEAEPAVPAVPAPAKAL
jgi:hypothetical protein